MIEVVGVNKTFGENHVLKDINTRFDVGKVNLVIGQSGSGKSVLAKCLVGLYTPETGQVKYDGQDFIQMDRKERVEIRKQIGMLFQGSALFDSKTVEENIMFPLTMFTKLSKKEKLKRVDFCLERVNLSGRNKLYPAECSGGMQKRIGIARAIAMNPKYLFCDEPNSGLDPQTAIVIDNLIRELTYDFKMTTIVITHDMNSVIEIGDQILFIHQGNNWWEGDRRAIITTENKEILNFVYASDFMKEIRAVMKDRRD